MSPRLSVTIIARNEEDRLPACLESVRGLADEIVVLDTLSTDRTVEIASAAGARVARHELVGFGPTKQMALELATGGLVLSLDADERVSPELAASIRVVLDSPAPADGYEIRRRVYLAGHRLRFSGLHDEWVLRLFRRAAGRFTEAMVHEHIEVQGRTERLAGVLEHHTARSFAEYQAKVERYAAMRAGELAARGVRWRWWDALRLPANFILIAFIRLGILDGIPGLRYAAITAYSSWLKRALLRRPVSSAPEPP